VAADVVEGEVAVGIGKGRRGGRGWHQRPERWEGMSTRVAGFYLTGDVDKGKGGGRVGSKVRGVGRRWQ